MTGGAQAAPPAGKKAAAATPERIGPLQVSVVPDKAGWTYQLGEPIAFTVRVLRDGQPVPGARVHYELGLEMMPPAKEGTLEVPAQGAVLNAEPPSAPGFVRCVVELDERGRKYRGLATAGVAPEAIKPVVEDPADFDAFWKAGKQELAALPVDAKLEPAPSTFAGAECFYVNLQNVAAGPRSDRKNASPPTPSRIYGVLCEPTGKGPFPALLNPPGAGIRSYRGMARTTAGKQVITLQMGIHGIPVNLPDELYQSLDAGALSGYFALHLDDPRRYYYRRVYLGMLRANDFLVSRPKFDGKNLYVTGGSQGGALSIVTAALDPRVRGLVAFFPALSDLPGFVQGRAGGWPFLFRPEAARTPEKLATARYYDVVNFARRVKVPGFYSWGYNDETCPPTSTFAAYNVITAPKRLALSLESGHSTGDEQNEVADNWLVSQWTPPARPKAPAAPNAGTAPRAAAATPSRPQ